jgi:hypothetical protein
LLPLARRCLKQARSFLWVDIHIDPLPLSNYAGKARSCAPVFLL